MIFVYYKSGERVNQQSFIRGAFYIQFSTEKSTPSVHSPLGNDPPFTYQLTVRRLEMFQLKVVLNT